MVWGVSYNEIGLKMIRSDNNQSYQYMEVGLILILCIGGCIWYVSFIFLVWRCIENEEKEKSPPLSGMRYFWTRNSSSWTDNWLNELTHVSLVKDLFDLIFLISPHLGIFL